MKKTLKILAVIFIIILILVLLKNIIMKMIYTKKYEEYVYKYSSINNIDPMLTFAVIKAESNFNSNAVSKSNAIGLMQLMENTAIEMGDSIDETINKEKLYDPETNIKLGTRYLAELLKRYNNNLNLTLAAYNAGIGNVEEWISSGIIKEDGSDIENIPFKETNNYVRKILRDYEIYKSILQ